MDDNGRAFFTFIASSRWLGSIMDASVFFYAILNVLFAIGVSYWLDIDASLVAMSISIILEVGGTFQYTVRLMIEV